MIASYRETARRVTDPTDETLPLYYLDHAFDLLESQIAGELRTVSDALEDWRDIVPEEVEAMEAETQSRAARELG